jgi:hypothetical protein
LHYNKYLIVPLFALVFVGGVVSTAGYVDAKSKYTLSMKFTDYCSGYGNQGQKVTVTLTNTATDERLAKKTFKFKDVVKHDNKASMSFDRKDSRSGDVIDVDAKGTGPGGGDNSGNPVYFDVKIHKYKSVIDLDEFGC